VHHRIGRHRRGSDPGVRPTLWRLAAVAGTTVLLVTQPSTAAQAHAGGPTARPVISTVEPNTTVLTVHATYSDNWRIELTSRSAEAISVLDPANRPFLRFTPGGVEADFGAAAWQSASVSSARPGASSDHAPDWRLISRTPSWSWRDPRIRPEQGLLTQEVLSGNAPVRLRDFEVPLLIGGVPGRIAGYLRYEPLTGTYRHTIVSSADPIKGLHVGSILGQSTPTLTIDNETGSVLTILGRDDEPFARLHHDSVEANVASPTWAQVGQHLGFLPAGVSDPFSAPQWKRILDGRRWSWPDYRSAPPELPPPFLAQVLANRKVVQIRRWTIPLEVGARRIEIRGITDFVPKGTEPARMSAPSSLGRLRWPVAVGALLLVVGRKRNA